MTQQVYRGNLSAAKFPLISEFATRTVIVPQYDNTYVPVVASKADDDKDRGIPQIYYCHNVMPTDQGWQSIAYKIQVQGVDNGFNTNNIYQIRSGIDKAYFHHREDGTNWIYLGGNWIQINSVSSFNPLITVAYIDDETYIYFTHLGCFRYDFPSSMLIPVTLTGLSTSDIIGIFSTAGYLLAWSLTAIAWSSTIDPTDFVPSLVSGAGGGSVQGARGSITVCAPHSLGFIVYTTQNAIAGVYSGNARFPFNFKEITGSGGCTDLNLISWDSNAGVHYAYTSSGLQLIALSGATTFLPEVTDFLAGKYYETFNEDTLEFNRQAFTGIMRKRITIVADRYLCISYGLPFSIYYTDVLIYDIVTKRYGKLKIPHVKCFEWAYYEPELSEAPRESIALLEPNGLVNIVNFAITNPDAVGVMILGKFQFIRSRMLTLEEAHIENITAGGSFKLYNRVSLDGKNSVTREGYKAYSSGLFTKYLFSTVGLNHSLVYVGAFHAVGFVLHFSTHGKSNFI